MNVRKMEDLCAEWNEWDLDVVGVSETQLRERMHMKGKWYKMIEKGRSKWKKKGDGVGIIMSYEAGLEVEEMNVGTCEMREDIIDYKVR